MSSRRETLRLSDIIENADAIAGYIEGLSIEKFAADRMRIDAVERCLERIIEAAAKIGAERMAEIVPDLPMERVRGLGNRLRHSYDLIDLGTIWETVIVHVPLLRSHCERALAASERDL
ncbi:MAG: hypothetical protein QOI38_2453 [Sphingomonadales bacterium]|jgi:uncharacterized protein with HEPN domain|nr:hypothetical protein [Sphingomonadales bacterium]